jgi:uncharacterized damage-inducible protein DinB
MQTTQQIAKHFREVFFGGNWTSVNLKETLKDINWQQAATQVHSCNSIATLVFHINYYVSAVLKVLQGGPLDAHDKFSFNLPPIQSQQDWEQLMQKTFSEAEQFAALVEQLPDNKLTEDFTDKKYGSYYRNLHGIIEHSHYHLGQISLLKKILSVQETGG